MALNIRFSGFCLLGLLTLSYYHDAPESKAWASALTVEPVSACLMQKNEKLTSDLRTQYARCLGWEDQPGYGLCMGYYHAQTITPEADARLIKIQADEASFYSQQRSRLKGTVEIQQGLQRVDAQTAYLYRDAKTNEITKIELLDGVKYQEPGRLVYASKATLYPQTKAGSIEEVLYRFDSNRKGALLPAWGRASHVERFPNQDYLLQKATYSNCSPKDNAWEIQAKKISLNHEQGMGVARDMTLKFKDIPVMYVPYWSFPTEKNRKSGFLMPMVGYSNINGFDLSLPYYWNIAPNYDATIVPHWYDSRGLMMGGEFRFLTSNSAGIVSGDFLPHDRAYDQFLQARVGQFPFLQNNSTDRWVVGAKETSFLASNLTFNLNYQQVSDDYYLQDFSNNLAVLTERQLLRQADVQYASDHWLFRGMVQSYQTLNPVNETPVSNIYERLPQLMARGYYGELPLGLTFGVAGIYDQYFWPLGDDNQPEGPRFYVNPVLSLPTVRPWGYFKPSVQWVNTYYDVDAFKTYQRQDFDVSLPRLVLDGGLNFERDLQWNRREYTQTLEPRLYYLNVPFQDQSNIPVYDSAYMIFSTDQLFRTNRFSGFDRVGDANQLAYGLTSRLLSNATGSEKASFTLGQIRYFANRKVQLCYNPVGNCTDTSLNMGYLSPFADYSPVASRLVYRFNPRWSVTGDYMWDPATRATNNADMNFQYANTDNTLLRFGYSYLVNGDITQIGNSNLQTNALHQATAAASLPISERWSTLGGYSYNLSKGYSMMSFLGVQYDSCCWAFRVLGGKSFQSLSNNLEPYYNTNVYLQVVLKGLGSLSSKDPYRTINTYLPGYKDEFH